MTKVKICGITNVNDARAAVEFGADALGFNFYVGSPRFISPTDARRIIDELGGHVQNIGVFVNERVDNIARIVDETGVTGLQLHGDESPEFIAELRKFTDCDVIKAFRVSEAFDIEQTSDCGTDIILLDGYSTTSRGGTGETFDWSIASSVSTLVERLYLAGGLTAENVRAAIQTVRPFAVDACSSLESAPGTKDMCKLERFIIEARDA